MDIHRCRFVPYPPSAINAVAFSHSHLTKSQKSVPVRLAVGRANGDIEIWNPLGGLWHQETILHGGKDRSIDGLVWVNEPDQILADGKTLIGRSRLFSIGYTSTVTEWDLEKGCPKKQANGMHGDIWCIGAQPLYLETKNGRVPVQNGKRLVAGTVDGSLALYSIDDGDLRFDRVLVKSSHKKTKMVSIAFQNRNVIVVGCSDSAIRVYDMRNGALLRAMTLGSDLAGASKDIIVWSVRCLQDGDIVSGDSTGHICIWDGKTYTQAQRLQTHKQDVLSLAVSADGSTIVSGGMDRRTVLYRKTSGAGTRWGKMWHRRYHEHDVKTMTSFEGNGMSVVVSGGPDARPVALPLAQAGMENHRALPHLPQSTPLCSASTARLVVSWWDREVHIWKLRKSMKDMLDVPEADLEASKNRKLLARILIKGEANITSATISNDGSLLLVSTSSEVKAFHLKPRGGSKGDELKISKVDLPAVLGAQGATNVQISPNAQWLCAIQQGGKVSMFQVVQDSDADSKPTVEAGAAKLNRLKRKIPKHIALGGLGAYDRMITHVTFSSDSKMLAVADLAGYIDTWLLQDSQPRLENGLNGHSHDDDDDSSSDSDDEDSDEHNNSSTTRWVRNPSAALLPKLNCAPTVLSFSPKVPSGSNATESDEDDVDDYTLLTVTARGQFLTVNPTQGSLTAWSRRNPTSKFPTEFRNIRDLIKGVVWAGERAWLYGNTFLCMIDMSQDFDEDDSRGDNQASETEENALVLANGSKPLSKKRKRGPDTGAGSKMEVGATGPVKVTRHVKGAAGDEVEDLPLGVDVMDVDESEAQDDEDNSDEDEERENELAMLRRKEVKSGAEQPAKNAFWHTFKYRPILGILPLGGEMEVQGNQNGALVLAGSLSQAVEVALIERPLFDVDMPERYVGASEADR